MPEPKVSEIMRRDVPTVTPDATIATVARILADHRLTGVPVVERGEIIGIITEFDLIMREADVDVPAVLPFMDAMFVADAGIDFGEELRRVLATTARQLMSSPVYNIRASATINQIATLMVNKSVNTIPVVDQANHLVGIVTRADLVRIIARLENADQRPSPATPATE